MNIKIEFKYFEGFLNHKNMTDNLNEAFNGLKDKIELKKFLLKMKKPQEKFHFMVHYFFLINVKDIK